MSLFKKMRIMAMAALRGDRVMTCGETLDHLFEYLDNELDVALARRVGDHLELCAPCATRADFEQAFLKAVASASEVGDPVPDSVRVKVLAALDEAERAPGT